MLLSPKAITLGLLAVLTYIMIQDHMWRFHTKHPPNFPWWTVDWLLTVSYSQAFVLMSFHEPPRHTHKEFWGRASQYKHFCTTALIRTDKDSDSIWKWPLLPLQCVQWASWPVSCKWLLLLGFSWNFVHLIQGFPTFSTEQYRHQATIVFSSSLLLCIWFLARKKKERKEKQDKS